MSEAISLADINLDSSLRKVMSQVHPNTGFSKSGLSRVNTIMHELYEYICKRLIASNRDVGLTVDDIVKVVNESIPGDIAKHANREGKKAVDSFTDRRTVIRVFKTSHTKKYVLHYTRVELPEFILLYITAMLEYLSAEILELAGNVARDDKKSRVTQYHVSEAIYVDKELFELLARVKKEQLDG
jgi:hypothetical protein